MFGIFVGCIVVGFIAAIVYGSYLIKLTRVYNDEFYFPVATNTVEVPNDWDIQPLIDVRVGRGTVCPYGMEPVFDRNWYGLHLACDCSKSDSMFNEDFQIGVTCEIRSGCATILAYPAIRQDIHDNDVLICGVRDGYPYRTMGRVINEQGDCPEGMKPCIENQKSIENIICYQEDLLDDYCPITSLLFVPTD